MSSSLKMKDLEKWIGKVGWVHPELKKKTATIAVKVVGVKWSWGKWLLEVSPLAGTGSWNVEYDRVEFDREGDL